MQTKSIVITGPESSGKTTLANRLADHFGAQWLPEYAREYIDQLERPYTESDLLAIAEGQLAREQEAIEKSSGILFLDTSLEVIKIWGEYKFGRCHPWILDQMQKQTHTLYLLCQPDIPWEYDPQRENPSDRDVLFDLYRLHLTNQNIKFVEINGLNEIRLTKAIHHVQSLINLHPHADHA